MKKKITTGGLAAILAAVLLAFGLPTALSVQGQLPVTLHATPTDPPVDGTVAVQIQANQSITDGKLVLEYDAASLTYQDTQAGSAWGSQSGDLIYDANPDTTGKVVLAFAAPNGSQTGTAFTVSFLAEKAGATTVRLAAGSYLTGSGDMDITDQSVSITVTSSDVPSASPSPAPSASPAPSPSPSPAPSASPSPSPAPSASPSPAPNPGGNPGGGLPPVPQPTLPPVVDQPCDGGVNCPSHSFTDVDPSLWYHEAVDYMVENGLMVGTTTTTFSPDVGSTRGMLITILYRYAGSPQVTGEMPFSDVTGSAFYHDAVLWAYQNNVAQGIGADAFGPDELITREQLASFLYRYAQYAGLDTDPNADLTSYPDADQISGWANQAMSWAVAQNIVQGGSNSMILPQDTATRAHIAAMVSRFATNV